MEGKQLFSFLFMDQAGKRANGSPDRMPLIAAHGHLQYQILCMRRRTLRWEVLKGKNRKGEEEAD